MQWRDMTIGRKIAVGFGVVLIMLGIVGILSYTGVNSIVKNAGQVIDGNKLDGLFAQKEVDHLNWANEINALLTDDGVTTLNVEMDHRQCACGKWLYGEGRQQAEAQVPSRVRFWTNWRNRINTFMNRPEKSVRPFSRPTWHWAIFCGRKKPITWPGPTR